MNGMRARGRDLEDQKRETNRWKEKEKENMEWGIAKKKSGDNLLAVQVGNFKGAQFHSKNGKGPGRDIFGQGKSERQFSGGETSSCEEKRGNGSEERKFLVCFEGGMGGEALVDEGGILGEAHWIGKKRER